MAAPKSQEYSEVIDEVLAEWTPRFIAALEANARKRTRKASGKSRESFEATHIKSTGSEISRVLASFEGYLRYQDIRNSDFSGPPVEAIAEWVKEKGINKFLKKHNREYPNGIQPDKLANRIAWGIIMGKKKMKRRRWYSKKREGYIQQVYLELLERVGEAHLARMKSELK